MSTDPASTSFDVPRWLPWAIMVIVVIGIGLASYLTISHYTTAVTLACPDTGAINCAKVTTSAYSKILGVPVALLGLLYYVALLPLNLPVAWRSRRPVVRWGRLLFTASGLPMILWLIYVELFKLNAICLYCTSVHVLTLFVFGLTAYGTAVSVED